MDDKRKREDGSNVREVRGWSELSSAEVEAWKAAVDLFKSENTLYFSRNNVFLTINGVLLVVVSGAFESYPFVNLLIAIFGGFLCVMWYRISVLGKHYSAKWANIAKEIEATWAYRPVDRASKQSLATGSPPMRYGKATDNFRYLIIGIFCLWAVIAALLVEDGAYYDMFGANDPSKKLQANCNAGS